MTQKTSTPRQKAQNFKSLKEIKSRNATQENYLRSIENNIVTFGVGPAGTGKSFVAMYQALCYLWNKKNTGINKILLTRPAVEAGERLGFLPGIIEEKLDPYMRPLYDALYDIAGHQEGADKIKKGIIELAPVAFMRGRTFQNSFIILDEAQNCTWDQIKMALTRLGDNVKLVINGDPEQSDLKNSGLLDILDALENTENVGIVEFEARDVVRSQIVKDMLISIENYEKLNSR